MGPNVQMLSEITKWRLEAKDEDNSRYFYYMQSAESLASGDSSYVVGRKGSGKTAIAEHFRSQTDAKTFARKLSFKNFPFNELYKLDDKSFTKPSQYTSVWKYIIYTTVLEMMSKNQNLPANIVKELSDHFLLDTEKTLAASVRRITDRSGGENFFGAGAQAGAKSAVVSNDTPWYARVMSMENIINEYCDDSKYFVIFDELDEDYKDALRIERDSNTERYFELLTGLFKATADVRAVFRREKSIFPMVFLREDIYDQIRDNDKNKWNDSVVRLNWSEGDLERLSAYRISRALSAEGSILAPQEAFHRLFQHEIVQWGSRKRQKRATFRHILASTLMRPRDVVSYIREAAREAQDLGAETVSREALTAAELGYSMRFRQEFVDEIASIIPNIEQIFDMLSQIRKPILPVGALRQHFEKEGGAKNFGVEFESMCDILFHFSVLGNEPHPGNKIFKYQSARSKVNIEEPLCLHRGLYKSLQI